MAHYVIHTASLALLSLSSILALLRVPRRIPNMLFPRLRSLLSPVALVKSSRGRFLEVAGAAGSTGDFCSSSTAAWLGS